MIPFARLATHTPAAASSAGARRRCALIAAAGLLTAAAALAGPAFPPRKPGLWEMRMSEPGAKKAGETMLVQHCVDAATDKALQAFGDSQPNMNRKFCKEELRSEVGQLLVHHTVCKQTDTTMTTRVVISGDFNSSYRVQSATTFDPPVKGRAPEDMLMEAKWIGACAAGQKPGDMIMPGGMKMNVSEILKMMPAAGGK